MGCSTASARLTNGRFEVTLEIGPDENCLIQAPTNMTDWVDLSHTLTDDGLADCEADRFKQRFYRLIRRDNEAHKGEERNIR